MVCRNEPATFTELCTILVQEEILGDMMRPHLTIGSEGDSVVSRGEAGEDSRAEVALTTSSSRTICIVEVRKVDSNLTVWGDLMSSCCQAEMRTIGRSRTDGLLRALVILEAISFLKDIHP